MEEIESTQQAEDGITISNAIKDYLLETSKWGKFLGIVGYVGIGLLILVGLGVMIGFSISRSFSDVDFPMGAIGLVYLVIAVLYYFPINYLYKFSVQIKQGLDSSDHQSVKSGFENLKSLFKFMGIFTIIVLSIYALILVIALPASLL